MTEQGPYLSSGGPRRSPGPAFDAWLLELEQRHLADLRLSEVARALRALSSGYVERRGTPAAGRQLEGTGKRAAFALYYAPLHFLLVRAVVEALPGGRDPRRHVVDLGCGTGAAGAAWATRLDPRPVVTGIDRHPWALGEAAASFRAFGLRGRTRRGDAGALVGGGRLRLPPRADALVAAYVVNELEAAARDALLPALTAAMRGGTRVLIVEPIARMATPWWERWADAFTAAGGRADEWRLPIEPPPIVARLARAAGLRPEALTARTLWG